MMNGQRIIKLATGCLWITVGKVWE